MNQYLVAFIGFLAMLIVGFVFYGSLFKETVKSQHHPETTRVIVSMVAIYLAALAFTIIFNDFSFASGVTGALKGFYLGLLLGLGTFALPLYADASYLQAKAGTTWVVLWNWVVSFIVLGLVVGLLTH